MMTRWSARLRAIRRWFSRSEWVARWLKLPKAEGASTDPGLLLIQIDGLSRLELERGLKHGQMPFTQRLLSREGYRLHDFYSGLPSTTPAVQGELFYGVRTAVPAFAYRDHETGELVRMFHPEPALKVQARLSEANVGILSEGSAYCDIYAGGAVDSQYCAVDAGLSAIWKAVNPWRLLSVAIWHSAALIRVIALILIEVVVALADVVHGTLRGRDVFRELKFILSRVAVAITLRELATNGALIDAARGVPIIHVNLLGYDEHSHQRGPSSQFAHWVLKGVDRAIKQMWKGARRSSRRDYDIWVYADHGQEKCRSYIETSGRTIQAAVEEVLLKQTGEKFPIRVIQGDSREGRSRWLGSSRWLRWPSGAFRERTDAPVGSDENEVMVIAIGPVGHVYLSRDELRKKVPQIARAMVDEAQVPLVAYPLQDGQFFRSSPEGLQAVAETGKGTFLLPDQASEVLGSDHPFLEEAAQDLVAICHHVDAGDIVFFGYQPGQTPITFALEVGAHGGPGKTETNAFCLLPADTALPASSTNYLRPETLRTAVLHALGTTPITERNYNIWSPEQRKLRVMTYNVHACIGMDDQISLRRIARVIEQSGADVIALQELDVMRRRTGSVDQIKLLGEMLAMDHFFHPAVRFEEELYGHAILSRVPMRLVKSALLPGNGKRPRLEPRGAIWVELLCGDQTIQFLNTHLGLNRHEQYAQATALLGDDWLGNPDIKTPTIVCGDFNARPKSQVYRLFRNRYADAQQLVNNHRPRPTWISVTPFNRIDHIFVTQDLKVSKVDVPRTSLTRVASDHLPLWADIEI